MLPCPFDQVAFGGRELYAPEGLGDVRRRTPGMFYGIEISRCLLGSSHFTLQRVKLGTLWAGFRAISLTSLKESDASVNGTLGSKGKLPGRLPLQPVPIVGEELRWTYSLGGRIAAPAAFAHDDKGEVEIEGLARTRFNAAICGATANDDHVAPQHVQELGDPGPVTALGRRLRKT
jgi:hypothetical protein